MALISLLLLTALLPNLSHSAGVDVGIINGTEAKPHSRPYMVSLQVNGGHLCGGFLVSQRFVMTAAHCYNRNSEITAVLGAHDLSDKGEGALRREVETYYVHPIYQTWQNVDYDIMLLKLKETVPLGPTITTIRIPKIEEDIPVGTICSVAGWGQTGDNESTSNRLMETSIRVIDCKKHRVNKQRVCAVHPGGACFGDSGGPLVFKDTAVGIDSFITGTCEEPQGPNGFAKISAFLPWISSILDRV
ncbi:mast cell protease 4-like isoform X1 [Hoplias malabaricus]|uniref:mast cell protease 4-like isoform X1 n=1 Tax=Hoplias malabaricus TaxID=27720 RepID=UPI00346180DF